MALSSMSTIITRLQNPPFSMSATEAQRRVMEAAEHRDRYDGGNIVASPSNISLTSNAQLVALAKYLGCLRAGD